MNGKLNDHVAISVSRAEALVLFEYLSRSEETKTALFEHAAEEIVLWRLCAQLEKSLVEVFAPDYLELVSKARDALAEEGA